MTLKELYDYSWEIYFKFDDVVTGYQKKKKEAYKKAKREKKKSVVTVEILKEDVRLFVREVQPRLIAASKFTSNEGFNFVHLVKTIDVFLLSLTSWTQGETCSRKLSTVMNLALSTYGEQLKIFRSRVE